MRTLVIVAIVMATIASLIFALPTFFRLYRPFPSLAAGISALNSDTEGRSEFSRRLRSKFPAGSPQAILKAELDREGWGRIRVDNFNKKPATQYVQFERHISLLFVEVATISWTSDDDGNLIEIDGGYFRDAFFKRG